MTNRRRLPAPPAARIRRRLPLVVGLALAPLAGCRAGSSIELRVSPDAPAEIVAWGDEPYAIVENLGPGLLRVRLGTTDDWPLLDRKLRAGAVMGERTGGDMRIRLDAEAETSVRVEARDALGLEQRTATPESGAGAR